MTRLTRSQKRVPYLAPVSVAAVGEDSRISGEALNLSVAGMLVRSAAACSPGSEVFCDVPLTDGVSRLKGRVTRLQRLTDGTGMAIQFLDLSEQDEAMLNDVVENRSDSTAWGPGQLPSVIIADDLGSDLDAVAETTEVGPPPVAPTHPRSTWYITGPVAATAVVFALLVAVLGWYFSPSANVPAATARRDGTPTGAAPSIVPPAPQIVPPAPVIVPTPPRVAPIDNPVLAAAVGQRNEPKRAARPRRPRPAEALTFDADTNQFRLADSVALDLGGARLTNVAGLTASSPGNLRGINVAVPQDVSEMRVDLPLPEPDSNYGIQVTPSWPTAIAISEKTEVGFTIKFATRAPASARFDWFLAR